MSDLNDLDRPILTDLYQDVIDTLRENTKRVSAAALPAAGGTVGPIAVTGAVTASGEVSGSGVTALNGALTTQALAAGDARVLFKDEAGVLKASVVWVRSSGTLDIRGTTVTVNGDALVTAGTFDPADFLAVAGGTLTGALHLFHDGIAGDEPVSMTQLAAESAATDAALALKAPLASPALTGTPTAPTAAAATNTTQLATTAFVQGEIAAIGASYTNEQAQDAIAAAIAAGTQTGLTVSYDDTANSLSFTVTAAAFDAAGAAAAAQAAAEAYTDSSIGALGSAATHPATDFDAAGAASAALAIAESYADTGLALKAPLASPALTGTPTAPTAAAATNTTQLATTAFVQGEIAAIGAGYTNEQAQDAIAAAIAAGTQTGLTVSYDDTANSLSFTVTAAAFDAAGAAAAALVTAEAYTDAGLALKAPLASPAFTGTPTVPTAAGATNTTQAASTAFVRGEIASLVASSPSTLDTLNELALALGSDPNFAATTATALGLKAPLASPALTGTPTAPTAAPGVNTTQLATTAYVVAADVARAAAVAATYAPLASPALTGNPTAPTPSVGDNDTSIATTAFVQSARQTRVVLMADAAAFTPTGDTADLNYQLNTQAAGTLTANAPSGTPYDGQKLMVRIKSTNVQTFAWNAIYRPSTDLPLPTASSGGGKTDRVGFEYNATDSKWDCIAKVFGH